MAAAHYWTAVSAGALGKQLEAIAHLEAFDSAAVDGEGSVDGSLLEQGWEERYRCNSVCVCVCVCVCESERERERVCVCVCVC